MDAQSDQYFWGQDEFEDKVETALIGLYEDKDVLKVHKKREFKPSTPRQSDIARARNIGAYFIPQDRLCSIDDDATTGFQPEVDGFPETASWAHTQINKKDPDQCMGMHFLWKVSKESATQGIRGVVVSPSAKAIYRLLIWNPLKTGGAAMFVDHVTVSSSGKVSKILYPMQDQSDMKYMLPRIRAKALATLQFSTDRKYLWNVTALEEEAKATFGVYEEQIKSLLYARSLPLTETGRKRPILHWVNCHKRRIASGTDVDVQKHLRGITEFEMNGTLFQITHPMKQGGAASCPTN